MQNKAYCLFSAENIVGATTSILHSKESCSYLTKMSTLIILVKEKHSIGGLKKHVLYHWELNESDTFSVLFPKATRQCFEFTALILAFDLILLHSNCSWRLWV